MNRPGPGPMSPLSMNSNDSFASRYGSMGGTPNDPPYSGGPYGAARPPAQPSPPGSQHPSSGTDMSRPSASGSSLGRPPSSASSVGRSSDGRMGAFGGPPPPQRPRSRDSARSQIRPDHEGSLERHYHVLKGYLSASLRDEKGNIKPNKARDKLLRLSVTQFMELSTDVFDELIRREDERTGRVANVPKSLPPKPNFHPKRNQARQKLSTLPVERFRQLATDVFYELERRIPRFAGADMERPVSTASSNRAPSRNGMRPPPGMRAPPPPGPGRPPMGPNGMGPPQAPYQSFRPASPGPGGPPPGTRPPTGGSETSNYGRPLPKTFQSNTIVPNKSTMVEDDDNDDEEGEESEEDAFGLDKALSGIRSGSTSRGAHVSGGSEEARAKTGAQEAELAELRDKIEGLESRVLDKEQELESMRATMEDKEHELEKVKSNGQDREEGLSAERNEWYDLREELEQKHLDARRLNEELQREVEELQRSRAEDERGLHEQHSRELEELEEKHSDAQRLNDELQRELQSRAQNDHDIQSQHSRELEELQAHLTNSHQQTIGDLRAQLDSIHDQTDDLHQQLQLHQAENRELRQQLQKAEQQQLQHSFAADAVQEYERRIELLQEELAQQEKMTGEVRDEAMLYLQEMRDLSRQNDYAMEAEERLAARVAKLESENEQWRQRYTKVKAQNKHLRASTMGLGLQQQAAFDAGNLARKEGILTDGGLVRDVDVTRFQMSIDALLKAARNTDTEPMLDGVKNVVISVQAITSAIGIDGYPTPSPSPLSPADGRQRQQYPESVGKLKARVMGTANSLITATKQHASAAGLSPVALLDAAASNLTAAVIELIKAVGVRGSARNELEDSEMGDEDHDDGRHHQQEQQQQQGFSHTHSRANDAAPQSPHESMGSFYDDRLSPSHSPAAPPTGAAIAVQVSSPEAAPKPAPLNIGRSGTTKKTNGWFGGWGKKSSVDETAEALPQVNGGQGTSNGNGERNGGVGQDGRAEQEGEEEYDPYR